MFYIVKPHQITEVTAPAGEPVSLDEMKDHLRVDHADEDFLISGIIQAARQYVEKVTGRAMVERTYRADLPDFYDVMLLPFPPLQSVSSVKYYNTSSPSTLTTLYDTTSSPQIATEVLRVDTAGRRVLRVYGQSWPTTAVRHDAVQVTWKAGYAPTGSPLDYSAPVEDALRSCVLMVAADLYENRERQVIGQGFTPVANSTVNLILDQYRDFL